jgi:hypothetical protein
LRPGGALRRSLGRAAVQRPLQIVKAALHQRTGQLTPHCGVVAGTHHQPVNLRARTRRQRTLGRQRLARLFGVGASVVGRRGFELGDRQAAQRALGQLRRGGTVSVHR